MLEEANYPIPNLDPFETDILPSVLVPNPNALPFQSGGGESYSSDIYPPPTSKRLV